MFLLLLLLFYRRFRFVSFQIYSPTGSINRDHDDVRRFSDAANAGLSKALAVGARAPILAVFAGKEFGHANLVSLLAALETTYVVRPTTIINHFK